MDIGIAIQDFITVHEIENHSPYTITPDEVEKLLDAREEDKSLKPQLRKALTARNRAILTAVCQKIELAFSSSFRQM